jgi:hypothetical protein
MQVGRRIYYEKITGNIIVDTGERSGAIIETTSEQDFAAYTALAERVPETVGVIELGYGQNAEDFAQCNGYRIDPDTNEILFSYPDPNTPEAPPVYRKPLSEEIEQVKQENSQIRTELEQVKADGADTTLILLELFESINPPA